MDDIDAKKEFSGAPSPSEQPGWVYFIFGDDAIKIGYSTEPENRLKNLQTGCPRELHLVAKRRGSLRLEAYYKRKFRHLKKHGEWFRPDAALLRLVARWSITKPTSPAPSPILIRTAEPRMPRPTLAPDLEAQYRALDCKSRRAANKTERMKFELRKAMLREDAPANFVVRQDAILGDKPRIRVQAITSERRP